MRRDAEPLKTAIETRMDCVAPYVSRQQHMENVAMLLRGINRGGKEKKRWKEKRKKKEEKKVKK